MMAPISRNNSSGKGLLRAHMLMFPQPTAVNSTGKDLLRTHMLMSPQLTAVNSSGKELLRTHMLMFPQPTAVNSSGKDLLRTHMLLVQVQTIGQRKCHILSWCDATESLTLSILKLELSINK
jgi:hypothetical protein